MTFITFYSYIMTMNKCIKCDVDLDKQRAHLGYTECLECSDVEAYSAHTVYHIRQVDLFNLYPKKNPNI